MVDGDDEVCAVCTERVDDAVRLPGCGHRFHLSCVMTFCQYDARCPVCRRVPDGVHPAASPLTVTVEEVVDEIETAIDARRRAWQRYRARRRRVLNHHPRLNAMFEELQAVRRHVESESTAAERLYWRKCRQVWKEDRDLADRRGVLTRLRRRERRLERVLTDELRALVGDEPE